MIRVPFSRTVLEDLLCFSFSLINDFYAVVMTASLAYTVIKIILTAVRALNHVRSLELAVIGTSLISASFRNFSLRYCHLVFPPLVTPEHSLGRLY